MAAFDNVTSVLSGLNSPINRQGGNATSAYNWKINASGHAADWFFESIGDDANGAAAGFVTDLVQANLAASAQSMITVPMLPWEAKLGPNRSKLSSFSVAKYGPQQQTDAQWMPDAGNGVRTNGSEITGNDPIFESSVREFCHTNGHAVLEVTVAPFERLVDGERLDDRLRAGLDELQRLHGLGVGERLEDEGADDALRTHDLADLAREGELRAVRAAVHHAPTSARAHVEIADHDVEAARPHPSAHVLGLGEAVPHERARREATLVSARPPPKPSRSRCSPLEWRQRGVLAAVPAHRHGVACNLAGWTRRGTAA